LGEQNEERVGLLKGLPSHTAEVFGEGSERFQRPNQIVPERVPALSQPVRRTSMSPTKKKATKKKATKKKATKKAPKKKARKAMKKATKKTTKKKATKKATKKKATKKATKKKVVAPGLTFPPAPSFGA
jgi:outer membrane biosynthesis protein TonB